MNQIMKKFFVILMFGSALLVTVALSDLLFPLPHWLRTLCFGVGSACVGLWMLLTVVFLRQRREIGDHAERAVSNSESPAQRAKENSPADLSVGTETPTKTVPAGTKEKNR
jgi:hypothetical protein